MRSSKKLLVPFLALIVLACFEPIARDLDELLQQEETFVDPETMEPYTGPVFGVFPWDADRILIRANLKDGRFDGLYERYYATGQLRGSETYSLGVLNGPRLNYSLTGELEAREGRKNGRLEGPSERYYPNGQLETLHTYRDGYLYGLTEMYDQDGELHSRGRLEHDGARHPRHRRCGAWIENGSALTYPPCTTPNDSTH